MSGHRRQTKRTWDFVALPRGTLTRWCETIPPPALGHWLLLFDTLTAEHHNYREFGINDLRWLAWLRCKDKLHLRSTLERLQAADLISLRGSQVVSIPAVDSVWFERAEMSERKRRNRSGDSAAKIGGVAATLPPILATQPTTEKQQQKQSLDSMGVERPTIHPQPHQTNPPLIPPELIDDLIVQSSRALSPGGADGLTNGFELASPTNVADPEWGGPSPRPSRALLASNLVNRPRG